MGRRIVFSRTVPHDSFPTERVGIPHAFASEGMRAAASFGYRLAMIAVMPASALPLYISGTPFENGALYSDSPLRREIRFHLRDAKVLSVHLTLGTALYTDGPSKPCAVCEVYFKRNGKAYHKLYYNFDFTTGENLGGGSSTGPEEPQ